MTQKDFILSVFRFTVLSVVLFFPVFNMGTANAEELVIQGTPLQIHAFEDSSMGVFRWQGESFVQQYYGPYDKGSLIFLNGTDEASLKFGGQYFDVNTFTPVSHVKLNEWTIQTVYDAGETGVRITQTVSYVNGHSYYQIVWAIANTGQTTYNDVRFIHEGDTYFAGDDYSVGHWNEALGMVYLTNLDPALTGIMGFYGGIDSPATHHVEDYYETAWSDAMSGNLPDTVKSDNQDAGYALQWNRNSLAPGQTWTITAFEKWTESGYVQVIAPAQTPIFPGWTISVDFQIQNYQDVADTFNLTLTSEAGWTVSLPNGNTVAVPAGSLATVEATVQAPAGVGEVVDTLTLTATSQSNPDISNSDAVAIAVQAPATTKPIGPGSTVSDYTMMSFVHYPINPAATSVIGLPVNGNDFRMGTYDPQTGGYIEYGDNNLQITPGKAYWVLSRNGLNVSFAGNKVPLDENFEFELAFNPATGDGWNQIACPNEAAYNWSDILVVAKNNQGEVIFGPTPILEMTDNVYIDLRLWRWAGGSYFDDTALMEPYNGYWAKAKQENVFLVFPVAAQKEPAGLITALKKNIFLVKKWIFSPQTATADSGDTPPLPMASLSGENGKASSSGGGCFIDALVHKN